VGMSDSDFENEARCINLELYASKIITRDRNICRLYDSVYTWDIQLLNYT
jgi:hypothetical protein